MIVTRKMLSGMLIKYINREIDLSSLISWAEEMMMKDALGAVQLLTGYHPVYGVKPFRGFPDPLAF